MVSRNHSCMLAFLQKAQPLPPGMLDTLSPSLALLGWVGHHKALSSPLVLPEDGAEPSPFEMWCCITQKVEILPAPAVHFGSFC